MVCPANTVFYCDDISAPFSWTSIESGLNSRLYLHVVDDNFIPSETRSFIISISDGNYIGSDLATELQTKLNAALQTFEPSTIFEVAYFAKTNTIRIATSEDRIKFYILTPDDLKDKLDGSFTLNYDINNPRDCNEVLGNLEGISREYGKTIPFVSNFINMQPIRNIYIHSSLGSFQTVALRPNGYDNTIIKHVPVNANFNEMIYCDTVVVNDWLDCSGMTLRKIDFRLCNSRGDIIPLHGVNMSFSRVFAKANSEY